MARTGPVQAQGPASLLSAAAIVSLQYIVSRQQPAAVPSTAHLRRSAAKVVFGRLLHARSPVSGGAAIPSVWRLPGAGRGRPHEFPAVSRVGNHT
jgi:hypothetical protein